jgi:small subunit ribosomal protein S5
MARERERDRREERDSEFVDKLVHINRVAKVVKGGLVRVPLREGRTLHHDVIGRHGAGKVVCRAAPPGTGIIAGGPMRAVFETLGVQDVVAKSFGSSNPYNMVRATFDALKHEDSPRGVAARRGIKVSTLQSRRRETDVEPVEA